MTSTSTNTTRALRAHPMQNVLVTGGAGFIGSNFVRHLLAADPQVRVVNLDALSYAGRLDNLDDLPDPARHTFIHGDINDAALVARLLRAHRIDNVVHFAAESHVDRSITGPGAFVRTNVTGTFTLLEACRQFWLGEQGLDAATAATRVRFHHISTDEVYGSLGPTDAAFTERTPYDPRSPYSASKAASDHLVRAYGHTYGLPVTLSNCSNNYGPRQFPEKLIPLLLTAALLGRALPIYGDGGNVRDWLYVDDHCAGVLAILRQGQVGSTYNIGGRNEWRNLDLARLLCARIDAAFAADATLATRFPDAAAARGQPTASTLRFVTDRPGHDRRYAIDATRMETELGFLPRETFETGLDKTVAWYLANENWWRGSLPAAPAHRQEMAP